MESSLKVTKKAREIENEENYFETIDPIMARKYKIKSSASLTLGIISIVASTFWYLFIPSGVLAIVFGVRSFRDSGYKRAHAGFILGIIGLSIGLLIHLPLVGGLLMSM